MTIYGLYGAGGHGRETMFSVQEMLVKRGEDPTRVRFIVDKGFKASPQVNGVEVLELDEFVALPGEKRFNIAIADGKVRQRIAGACAAAGLLPFDVISSSAVRLGGSTMGDGAMLSPFAMISTNVRIGKFFLCNAYSSIMHDCVIGDYVTLSPGVRCNGNVHIGDHAFFGSGAVLRNASAGAPPLRIGEGAVIGMGAVVVKDVEPYTTVVGNPARELVKKEEGK